MDREGEQYVLNEGKEYIQLRYQVLISFFQTWDLMLGYGSTKFQTVTGCFLYILATIFINIAMLNMVISVIGDSYDKVQMTKKE